tara:strand:+ start:1380 stop:2129 length:750 start_codon:yes stop_codon:yes gene_type:complete
MEHLKKVLYLNPVELDGPRQMAIDLFLLEKSFSDKNFYMAIRFYTWDGDWLSIGKNQKKISQKWMNLSKNKKLKLIRRPSGGRAVLHSGGITYALIWKDPPRNKKESYLKISQWLKDGYKKAGVDLFFGNQPVRISDENCFASSTLADLVDKDKNKHIGSAQYWRNGHLLQHGEILMNPSKELWREVFNNEPPKLQNNLRNKDKIINFLKGSLISTWPGLKLVDYTLDSKDEEVIKHLIKKNFYESIHL